MSPRTASIGALTALLVTISSARPTLADDMEAPRHAAVAVYLRHIYWVYFGLRSCREIAASEGDASYEPEVSSASAQQSLRAIETGAGEIGIDVKTIWADAAPRAQVTAEALKTNPAKHLKFCKRMGSLFRDDEANIQANYRALGAKAAAIPKDFQPGDALPPDTRIVR